MEVVAHRFDVYLVALEHTRGHEIQKTRPCVIVSPDEMNEHIGTVIIAPMTTQGKNYPSRVALEFNKKKGKVVLDQIRTVDKSRLIKHMGSVAKANKKRLPALPPFRSDFAWASTGITVSTPVIPIYVLSSLAHRSERNIVVEFARTHGGVC